MGYTVELWAGDLGRVIDELTEPTLTPDTVDAEHADDEVLDRWDECAALVADAVATGGGALVGEAAYYAHTVIATLSHFYGALDHTSAGGDEFRDGFLGGTAARHFGAQFIDHLIDRPIAGLTGFDYPTFGWADPDELDAAIEHADRSPLHDPPDDHVGGLHIIDNAARRAAKFDLHLITAYL